MCACLSASVFSPKTCPRIAAASILLWGAGLGESGGPSWDQGGTWPALGYILPVLSMALYKWDFGSHLFRGEDNELGGDEKNAKARRFFRMSRGLRDVKDE